MLIKPPATMLQGDTGTGKTRSILTMIEAGIETFVLCTESTGIETLLDGMDSMKLDRNLLHYKHIKPSNMKLTSLITAADNSNKKSVSDLQKVDSPALLQKNEYRQYIDFLTACQNFKDDRNGKSYGDITSWDDTRCFAVDSLTGLNLMVSQLQAGNRGTLTLPDYNVIQLQIESLVSTLTALNCFFIMTGHLELEKDEISGKIKVMTSTVGKKLAPKLPINFSEVVRTRREGKEFFWATEDSEAHLKSRSLPRGEKLKPSFVPIVEAHRKRKELAQMEVSDADVAEVQMTTPETADGEPPAVLAGMFNTPTSTVTETNISKFKKV